ncbi:MAG: biopolymer transporter ExbD [Chlamydiales bacterium]|nr:biopolymer transporter ExbD [Chlamydiales bacterium]
MIFKTRLKHSYNLIDLTPLVDVIFLLLIFFLITSDVLPLKSLNIENPTLPKDSLPLTTQLLVVMDAQQVIYVGSKKDIVDLGSVKEHLLNEINMIKAQYKEAHPTIVLSVDKHVDYGSFLQLFCAVQECSHTIRLSYKPSNLE